MSDTPEVVEGVATPVEEEVGAESTEKNGQAKKGNQNFSKAAEEVRQTASKTFNEAIKQVETIGKALGNALQDRSNVVMVRVNNDCLQYLDMMVEADVANSRSEAAAFLINEGIKSNEELFHKIRNISDQISSLKSQLRETIKAS